MYHQPGLNLMELVALHFLIIIIIIIISIIIFPEAMVLLTSTKIQAPG